MERHLFREVLRLGFLLLGYFFKLLRAGLLKREDQKALLRCLIDKVVVHREPRDCLRDIEYTYESNRIEGNTLTLRETEWVVEKGLTVGGKSMREHLEAINHHEALLFLRDVVRENQPLTESLVRQLHALILHGIDHANAGRYRKVPVMIAGSRHIPPQPWAVPVQMEQCFAWYEAQRETVTTQSPLNSDTLRA